VQANLVVLSDAPQYAAVFVEETDPATCSCAQALLAPGTDTVIELAREAFGGLSAEYVSAAEARDCLRRLVEAAKERGIKGKSVYHPLRVALSGRDEGPELFYLVGGLGKSTILARLKAAADALV